MLYDVEQEHFSSYIRMSPSTSCSFAVDFYYKALLGYPSTSASNPVFVSYRAVVDRHAALYFDTTSLDVLRVWQTDLIRSLQAYLDHFRLGTSAPDAKLSFGEYLPSAPLPAPLAPAPIIEGIAREPKAALPLPEDLTADHAALLTEIYSKELWSWRDLEEILGPSHTSLQRIAKRQGDASYEVGRKILDLHRFV